MGAGRNSYFGWVQETPWGTPVTPPTKWLEIVSEGLQGINDQVARPVIRALHKREGNLYDEKQGGAGPVACELNYVGLLRLLEHLTGTSPSASAFDAGARNEFNFTLAAGELMAGKGLTGYIFKDQTQEEQYAGMKIRQGTFSFDPKRNSQIELDFVAKAMLQVAVTAPTFPGTSTYVAGHQLSCEIDDVVRKFDSATLTINNALDDDKRVLGSKNIDEPVRADMVEVTGEVTVDAVQADLTKFLAGTLFKLEFNHTGAVLGTGNYKLNFLMNKCRLVSDPIKVDAPGIVKSTLAFEALLPTTGLADMLSILVSTSESVIA
jgi:hypothetical protein